MLIFCLLLRGNQVWYCMKCHFEHTIGCTSHGQCSPMFALATHFQAQEIASRELRTWCCARIPFCSPHPLPFPTCACSPVSSLSLIGFVPVYSCSLQLVFSFNTCYSWATLGAFNPTSSGVTTSACASPSKARLLRLQKALGTNSWGH
jgi:hypothetical protein